MILSIRKNHPLAINILSVHRNYYFNYLEIMYFIEFIIENLVAI